MDKEKQPLLPPPVYVEQPERIEKRPSRLLIGLTTVLAVFGTVHLMGRQRQRIVILMPKEGSYMEDPINPNITLTLASGPWSNEATTIESKEWGFPSLPSWGRKGYSLGDLLKKQVEADLPSYRTASVAKQTGEQDEFQFVGELVDEDDVVSAMSVLPMHVEMPIQPWEESKQPTTGKSVKEVEAVVVMPRKGGIKRRVDDMKNRMEDVIGNLRKRIKGQQAETMSAQAVSGDDKEEKEVKGQFFGLLGNVANEIGKGVGGLTDHIIPGSGDIARGIGHAGRGLGNTLDKGLDVVKSDFVEEEAGESEKIEEQDIHPQFFDHIGNAFNELGKGIGQGMDQLIPESGEIARKVGNVASGAGNALDNFAGNVMENVKGN